MTACSFSSARFLVSGVIQSISWISFAIAVSSPLTICSIRSLLSPANATSTYSGLALRRDRCQRHRHNVSIVDEFLGSDQSPAVEIEVFIHERGREHSDVQARHVPGKVCFQIVQRRCRQDLIQTLEELGVRNVEVVELRRAELCKITDPS